MALTIVQEDGTGLSTANAYSSVAETESFLTDMGLSAYVSASASAKIRFLIEATGLIDQRCEYQVNGSPVATDQALLFPRYNATDSRLRYFESDELPAPYVEAVMLMAERLAEAAAAGVRVSLLPRSSRVASESSDGHAISYRPSEGFWELYPEVWDRASRAFPPGLRSLRA